MHLTQPLMGGQASIDPPPSSFFFSPPFPTNQGRRESIENQGNGWKVSWSWNVPEWTFTSKGTSEKKRGGGRHTGCENLEAGSLWMWSSKLRWRVRGTMLAAQMEDERSKTLQMNWTNRCSAVNTAWHSYRKAKPRSTWLLWLCIEQRAVKGVWGFSAGRLDRSIMTENRALLSLPCLFPGVLIGVCTTLSRNSVKHACLLKAFSDVNNSDWLAQPLTSKPLGLLELLIHLSMKNVQEAAGQFTGAVHPMTLWLRLPVNRVKCLAQLH